MLFYTEPFGMPAQEKETIKPNVVDRRHNGITVGLKPVDLPDLPRFGAY